MDWTVRYLAMDLESGGIPEGTTVLSAYFQVLNDQMYPIASLRLLVKPNDGLYVCTAEALEINKINLIEHDKVAITCSEAGNELRKFLAFHSDNGKIKLIPMGKNVTGDINWVNEQILGKKTWNLFVSYRIWEVTTLALAAQQLGKLPREMSISLGSLVEYFHITIPGELHNEEYDTKATVAVNDELLRLISSNE